MNVKRSFKPTTELTKTEEKLKNPQEPNTQASESQEGLKHYDLFVDQPRPSGGARISRRVETSSIWAVENCFSYFELNLKRG
jgi:hypothetical protein